MQLRNKKVFFFSLIALACIALTFLVNWAFIIGAIVLMILNQRELFKNSNLKNKEKSKNIRKK